jgi:hypothetical protein
MGIIIINLGCFNSYNTKEKLSIQIIKDNLIFYIEFNLSTNFIMFLFGFF